MSAKNIILIGSFIVAILLIGSLIVTATLFKFGSSDDSITGLATEPTISGEQAITIALSAIKGNVEEIELEKENGRLLYSVEISNEKGEHNIKVDPYTGEIVKIEVEDDVGRKELSLIKTEINEDQAKAIALGKVGGTVKEVEVEKVNGIYIYEVEINKDGSQFEVSIDLVTGEVISIVEEVGEDEEEENGDFEELELTSTFSSPISKEEAIRIAEGKLSSGFDFEEIGTGRYKGLKVYEVEFEDGNEEAEVIIDIETGEILDIEYEEEDDDDD